MARKQGDALQRIVDALGGTRALAMEFDVSAWTVRAWMSGTRSPSPGSQRRMNAVATDFDLPLPYPQWATGVRRRHDGMTPARIATRSERVFGFRVVEQESGVHVVLPLRPGLFAVKMRAEDGSIDYAICNQEMRPLYRSAKSLEELRERFPDGR